MNIVVIGFLVILVALAVWVLLSAIFVPLGRIVYGMWKNLNDKLNKECEEEKEKEHEVR